jgi:hypothetical protein
MFMLAKASKMNLDRGVMSLALQRGNEAIPTLLPLNLPDKPANVTSASKLN